MWAAKKNLKLMEQSIAKNERVRLFGDWALPGRYSYVVSVIEMLAEENILNETDINKYPVSAVFFSNDNRTPNMSFLSVPNSLLRFYYKLWLNKKQWNRFLFEARRNNDIGEGLARSMLNKGDLVKPLTVIETPKLSGGWYAHGLYMKEVMEMDDSYISAIESTARKILASNDPESILKKLRLERDPMRWS